MICEFGERVNNEFNELFDIICQFEWYECLQNIQKCMPIIMIAIQQSIVLKSFGSIVCTRDFFKQVSLTLRRNRTFFYLLYIFR